MMKLQEGEEVLLETQPEVKVLVLWFFSKCIGFIIVGDMIVWGVVCVQEGIFESEPESAFHFLTSALPAGLIAAFIILLISFIYCVYLRRTYVYTITNRRCLFRGGILRRVVHSVPYHKVTDVEMSQHVFERMLGISSLGIYTPGTGSMGNTGAGGRRPEIAYVGLKDNEKPAEIINEMLSKFRATGE